MRLIGYSICTRPSIQYGQIYATSYGQICDVRDRPLLIGQGRAGGDDLVHPLGSNIASLYIHLTAIPLPLPGECDNVQFFLTAGHMRHGIRTSRRESRLGRFGSEGRRDGIRWRGAQHAEKGGLDMLGGDTGAGHQYICSKDVDAWET